MHIYVCFEMPLALLADHQKGHLDYNLTLRRSPYILLITCASWP